MQILHPLHVALLVSDLEQSSHFYGIVLGLEAVERPLNFPGRWYQLGTFQIHLITADRLIDDQVDREKWGRNRHLALAIANLQQAQAQLEAAGYPTQRSASGRAALFTQDPDGNVIELAAIRTD